MSCAEQSTARDRYRASEASLRARRKLPLGGCGLAVCIPIHPTQLYSSAANFIIFIALHFMLKASLKHNWKKGLIAASYLGSYSIARFTVEIFRGDERGNFIFAMSPSQVISLSGALIALFFFYLTFKKKRA